MFLAEVLGAFTENRRGWREFTVFLGAAAVLLGAGVLTPALVLGGALIVGASLLVAWRPRGS